MTLRGVLCGVLLAPFAALVARAQPGPAYSERYRPQFHFTPAANWMNDPNGLVFFAGEYHLFYQYNPFGNTWGHMSWGHAVSPDLVHWQYLPVAIPEVDGVMAFSGSAVVDWKNTSGFGRGGEPPLVAIYTGHRTDRPSQSQFLAYSTDRGRTWTRYAGNPVLDISVADFRDPKVFWYEPQQKWVMVLALSLEHKVLLYSSPDLKRWTPLSEFGPTGAVGGVWECPDLFELPVDGDPQKTRWVLIVNLNPGGVAGGSGAQYFVGDFDGTRFRAEASGATAAAGAPDGGALWADYGKDFYAAVSWSDMPRTDGRRVWIGWMNNWQYGKDIPTSPWRSAQSVPRELALRTTRDGVRLVQRPVAEIQRLRGTGRRLGAQPIPVGSTPLAARGISGTALEIVAELEAGAASELGVKVRTGRNEETVIGVDPRAGRLFVDRTRSGEVSFHPDFPGRHAGPLPIENGRVRLRILVDRSSVEVFAGDGRTVITDQIFPDPASDGVALYATGGPARLVTLEAWPLQSAWTASGPQASDSSHTNHQPPQPPQR
jgi:fructan beta-fructosidase